MAICKIQPAQFPDARFAGDINRKAMTSSCLRNLKLFDTSVRKSATSKQLRESEIVLYQLSVNPWWIGVGLGAIISTGGWNL